MINNCDIVLRNARALIDTPNKWVKGIYKAREGGCYCIVGAIDKACGYNSHIDNNPVVIKLALATFRHILPFLPEKHKGLVGFNDHPDTTHEDVMALFDRAIAASQP